MFGCSPETIIVQDDFSFKIFSSKINQFNDKTLCFHDFSPWLFADISSIMGFYYAFFEYVSSSLKIDLIGSHISGKQMAFRHNESSCVCQLLTPSCSKLGTFLVSKLYQNWPRQTLSCPETIIFQASGVVVLTRFIFFFKRVFIGNAFFVNVCSNYRIDLICNHTTGKQMAFHLYESSYV